MMAESQAELTALRERIFRDMGAGCLERFVAFLRKKAEVASYECSQIGAPDDFRRDMLATIRFCHSFADEAETALNAQRAAATAQSGEGFRQ